MLKELDILTTLDCGGFTTIYLFNKRDKILLPAQVELGSLTKECIKKVIQGLNGEINNIKIYHYLDGTFYSYLVINSSNQVLEINYDFYQSMRLAIAEHIPVVIEETILEAQGIRITPDLIKDALEGN